MSYQLNRKKATRGGKPKKISDEDRARIKALYRTGKWTYARLAKEYNVTASTIQKHVSNHD